MVNMVARQHHCRDSNVMVNMVARQHHCRDSNVMVNMVARQHHCRDSNVMVNMVAILLQGAEKLSKHYCQETSLHDT